MTLDELSKKADDLPVNPEEMERRVEKAEEEFKQIKWSKEVTVKWMETEYTL